MILPLLLVAFIQPPETERFAKWEKEIAGIEKRLQADPPKAGGTFFVGSSTIRLWNLKKSFPDAAYMNVGFGGSEIRDCTHFSARIIAPYKPKAIVFYAGDNDIASGRKPEQLLADFKDFAAAIHRQLPDCTILFLAVKPSAARWTQYEKQKRANAMIEDYCGKDRHLTFIDTAPLLLGSDGKPTPELYAKDGLHLSAAGYAKWTPIVKKTLKGL
jgi:lysophospholipase L1-like esterase